MRSVSGVILIMSGKIGILADHYLLLHNPPKGDRGMLFCFAKIEIWRASPGTFVMRKPNGYYGWPEINIERYTFTESAPQLCVGSLAVKARGIYYQPVNLSGPNFGILPIRSKCAFIRYVREKWVRKIAPIPRKCVFIYAKTHLLCATQKKTFRKKPPCINRKLLSAGWSIFAGRRRRYFSARGCLNGEIPTGK